VETGRFHGVDLGGQPDLAALVEPFGMLGLSVTRPQELHPAMAKALSVVRDGRTVLLNVHVNR
jgi:acetolactate synthase-1/2/3 large subunit